MDKGHWEFQKDFNIDEWTGFVYTITELDTGMKYIGKKFFKHKKTMPPLNGYKRKRVVYKESDWKDYTGSCKELNHSIKIKGLANYHFQIESLHETKGSLNYGEVEYQVMSDCFRSTMYYNTYLAPTRCTPPAVTDKEKQYKK